MRESVAYELIKKEGFEEGLQQGMERGLRQGFVQSARRLLVGALEARFETVPRSVLTMLQEIDDPDILEMLHKAAVRAESMEHFKEKLRAVVEQ
uniref:DUF4351 domain-containing protein n=1 Tax=Desulfacinum infernum TaxID=35837 RepID=A0A831ZY48_9BACT